LIGPHGTGSITVQASVYGAYVEAFQRGGGFLEVLGEDDGDELQVAVVPPSGTRESVLTVPRHRLTWLAAARGPTSQYWAIPGYFDAHRHLPPEGSSALSARKAVSTARIRAIQDAARDGIWGIRDMGVAMLAPWPVRSSLVATAIRGVAGANGAFARPFAVAGPDPRQIRRLVNENYDAGAHFIKIFTNGSGYLRQSEALEMTMTAEAIRAAVDAARARGMSVAAHCHGGDAFAACLDAKVGSIEHGLYLSEDDLTEARRRGVEIVLTPGAYDSPRRPLVAAAFARMVTAVLRTTVDFRIGTDSPHESMAGQILSLVRRGAPVGLSLRAAVLADPTAITDAAVDANGLVLLEADPAVVPETLLTPIGLITPTPSRDGLRLPMPSLHESRGASARERDDGGPIPISARRSPSPTLRHVGGQEAKEGRISESR
jgi:hypothetical protein